LNSSVSQGRISCLVQCVRDEVGAQIPVRDKKKGTKTASL
jgi:hypothetical protein